MSRQPKDPNTIGLKQKIMPKNLPEKWGRLYRRRYAQLSAYYRREGISCLPLEILIERFAFISCYILYLESPDAKEEPNVLSAKNLENYMTLQNSLNKQIDQIIKYSGAKKTPADKNSKTEHDKIIFKKKPLLTKEKAKELSDGKLKNRISALIRKGKGGTGSTAD